MEILIKENYYKDNLLDLEFIKWKIKEYTKDIFKKEKRVVMEFLLVIMEDNIREIGSIINSMVKEKKYIKMVQYMKENFLWVKNMVMEL